MSGEIDPFPESNRTATTSELTFRHMNPITAKGHNGTVHFDGKFVTIERTGGLARLSVGKGEKRIPVKSITAVQWKPPGMLANGYIEFTVMGGNESRSRAGAATAQAAGNENAVLVTKKQADDFTALRRAVEDVIADL